MANIRDLLNKIKYATYGKDIRQSIHDALEECYNTASTEHDNANMEVKLARGSHDTLDDRITYDEEKIKNNTSELKQKALQSDLIIERERINNLTKLGEGSTTGDAELMDGRIGEDGVTYENIGDSIRKQMNNSNSNIEQLRNFVVENSVNIQITEHVGYLNANGKIANDGSLHCKVTNKIYCNKGWVFSYLGTANANAVSYIMYKGNRIVKTGQHDKVKTKITIPEGVDNIIFSSYAGSASEISMEVKLIAPDILNKNNLVSNLNSKVGVSEFNDEFRDSLNYNSNKILKENMTKKENVYVTYTGGLVEAQGFNSYEIDVKEGELYHYNGYLIWSLAPYHVCDSEGNVILTGGDLKSHDAVTFFEKKYICIPKNGVKLRVCSGNKAGETDFYLAKKTLKVLKEKQIKDMIEQHKYDGVGDYKEITSNFTINSGSYINSGGSLTTDTNSQYAEYIDLNSFTEIYVTAHAKYSTRILAIYDSTRKCLGTKGYNEVYDTSTYWTKELVSSSEILKEFPTATHIRLCSYLNTQLSIYELKSSLKEILENFKKEMGMNKSNILYGKKYVACGDSFTEGDFSGYVDENGLSYKNSPKLYDPVRGMYKTYPWWIAERNNMVLINEAKCGSTMALSKEYINGTTTDIGYRSPFSLNRYKQVPLDADYMTLWFGLNETSTPLGTLNDTTNETILGAWNIVLEYFLTNMPYCKIGIVISDGWLNDTYANGIISVAEYWGIPYLDMRNNPHVPLMLGGRGGDINLNPKAKTLRNNAFYVTPTNGHPNVEAHEYQSTFIENWMRTL